MVVGPSTSTVPAAPRADDRVDVGGAGGGSELPRCSGDPSRTSNRSKDGAAQPVGGAATSKDGAAPSRTTASAHAPRPFQVACDVRPQDAGGSRRTHGRTPVQEAQGQDSRQHAAGGRARV